MIPATHATYQPSGIRVHASPTSVRTIEGTIARGRAGPDLTHVAGRTTIAAGTIPNMRGYLAGWVIDPQRIKPGVLMPQNNLNPQDVPALLEYLETLQ